MSEKNKLSIHIFEDIIVVKNTLGKEKFFPRCGIKHVESFVFEMAKKGQLDELM